MNLQKHHFWSLGAGLYGSLSGRCSVMSGMDSLHTKPPIDGIVVHVETSSHSSNFTCPSAILLNLCFHSSANPQSQLPLASTPSLHQRCGACECHGRVEVCVDCPSSYLTDPYSSSPFLMPSMRFFSFFMAL